MSAYIYRGRHRRTPSVLDRFVRGAVATLRYYGFGPEAA